MDSDDYRSSYKTLQMNFIKNSQIQFHKVEDRFKNEKSEPYYLIRITNYKFFQNKKHAKSMLNLKLFNILSPKEILINNEEILIITKDWSQYRLTEQILHKQNPKVIRNIILQLALTLNELSLKNITWNLYSIQQLYLIQECTFLQLVDLDDNHFSMNITNLEIFKNFASRYFQQYQQIIQLDNFEKIIKSLLSQDQGYQINQQNHFVLLNFFQVPQIKYGLEDVYTIEFETPKVFEIVYGIKAKSVQYKCFDQFRFPKQLLLEYQNRQIEISEEMSDCSNIVKCLSYLKIFDQVFFFEQRLTMNISMASQLLNKQKIDNIKYQRIAYNAIKQIMNGISEFHSKGFMHRNISPQTIYLDNEDLEKANFYIGDCEKAKFDDQGCLGTQQCDIYSYLPPESMEEFTMKSDLYSFGLVSLLILNRGIPLFQFGFLDETEKKKYFSQDYISQKLLENNLNYKPDLIQLISQCLSEKQEDRPDTLKVSKKISAIFRNEKIKIMQSADFSSK
ncbi:unnamed protein product [Paramecium sonneborni]|uniref:Protein kinase domain-containing protein n=1 Tax=Paramecium sonneborni TaxID=65129 RepID=A0A8S1NGK7_9CILI|nr:unnamed protein product [Paramecium sonneborni]